MLTKVSQVLLAGSVLVSLIVVGCGRPPFSFGASSGARDAVEVFVRLDKAPALNEPVGVTVSVRASDRYSGPVEAWLQLPPSAAFINGDMFWIGELASSESYDFRATVAFVLEGRSTVSALARFDAPAEKIWDTDVSGFGTWLEVTEAGGVLTPPGSPGPDNTLSYSPYTGFPIDGSLLLNTSDSPIVFLVTAKEGFDQLRNQRLVPAEIPPTWKGYPQDQVGVLERDYEDGSGMILAVYDRLRPTTGYHLAVIRQTSGYAARQMLGEQAVVGASEEFPERPPLVILDIISIAPKSDWPVERRPTSPYHLFPVPNWGFGTTNETDLVLRVNGEIMSREIVVMGSSSSQEVTRLDAPKLNEVILPR